MAVIEGETTGQQIIQESIRSELSPKLSSTGLVSFPGSTEYDDANLRFTEYERPTYVAVVKPVIFNDVVEAVNFARTHAIPLAARSGHHCVATTMKKLQDGILLDMRSLSRLVFDASHQRITVGGGVLADEFTKFIHDLGMEITIGSCPTTGVIGVSFGAGLGRLQGKYGYLHDNMVSCKLVLADGAIIEASETSNPDLFWACRGAGHNFGICLEATFKVYPQTNSGIHHSWDLGYSLDKCERLFEVLNDVHQSMPPDLSIFILWKRQVSTGIKDLILVNLVFHGPVSDAQQWISHFEALGPVFNSEKISLAWPDLPWESCAGQNKLLSRPEVWKITKYKGMAAVNVRKFDPAVMRAFFEDLKDMNVRHASKGWFGAMFECFSHERTRQFPSDSTAFPWRHGGDHQLMISATPKSLDDLELFESFVEKWKELLVQVSGYGRLHQYVNYGNTTKKLDPIGALYGYGPWRLRKLRGLKQKYDPYGFFSWYQPFA